VIEDLAQGRAAVPKFQADLSELRQELHTEVHALSAEIAALRQLAYQTPEAELQEKVDVLESLLRDLQQRSTGAQESATSEAQQLKAWVRSRAEDLEVALSNKADQDDWRLTRLLQVESELRSSLDSLRIAVDAKVDCSDCREALADRATHADLKEAMERQTDAGAFQRLEWQYALDDALRKIRAESHADGKVCLSCTDTFDAESLQSLLSSAERDEGFAEQGPLYFSLE
jgi:hypothetical protein